MKSKLSAPNPIPLKMYPIPGNIIKFINNGFLSRGFLTSEQEEELEKIT